MNQLIGDRFESERLSQIKEAGGFAKSVYVVPLFLVFSFFDYFYFRNFFELFFILRLLAVGSVYLFSAISKRIDLKRNEILTVCWVFIGCALPILIMLV
jgi:hypothetical protein